MSRKYFLCFVALLPDVKINFFFFFSSLWRVECERVGPTLHIANTEMKTRGVGRVGTSSTWRLHLNSLRYHLEQIQRLQNKHNKQDSAGRGVKMLFDAPQTLPWAVDLTTLQRGEPLLGTVFSRMQKEYQTLLKTLKLVQTQVEDRRVLVSWIVLFQHIVLGVKTHFCRFLSFL